jgi:hypothetical protein
MRGKVGLVVAATAMVLAIGTGAASAGHAAYECDWDNWVFTDNNFGRWSLELDWINWSYYDSTGDYIAWRFDQYGNSTMRVWHPGSEPAAGHITSDGLDNYRYTDIQRAGYGWRQYGMSEYSHAGCD